MRSCALALVICAAFSAAFAEEGGRLVYLDVEVANHRTGAIPDLLGPGDFEVYSNGRMLPVRRLAIDTPPMDIAFVIYLSNKGFSTRDDRQRFGDGLRSVTKELRHGDRAAVIRGSGPAGLSSALTEDFLFVEKALLSGDRQPDENRLFDAISSAASLLPRTRSLERRSAIVALTDDVDRHSESTREGLQESLLRNGLTVHEVVLALLPRNVGVDTGLTPLFGVDLPRVRVGVGSTDAAPGSLMDLVRATGGAHRIGDNFDTVLPALLRSLRLRYTLAVEVPAAPAAFHPIEVKLGAAARAANPDARVHTRIGYYSEP